MNGIKYNNYDVVIFNDGGFVVVAVTFYRYYRKRLRGEINYRWKTRCVEFANKLSRRRTAVFTGQLIQLAKAYGEKTILKYEEHERAENK